MDSKAYKKLKIWQSSNELAIKLYKISERFPKEEIYGLTSQIRRASFSVPLNIVEGHASQSKKEFLNFLNISNRSLVETEYLLEICLELKFMDHKDYIITEELRRQTSVMLKSFIQALKNKI